MSGSDAGLKLRESLLSMVERHPIAERPESGRLAFVDNGSERGRGPRGVGARFNGEQWLRLNGDPLGFDPTFWTCLRA